MSKITMPEKETPRATRSEKERKEAWLDEVLHIEFVNVEEPGCPIKFSYGSTLEKKNYTLLHGGKYHLPRRVVQHVESRQTPIWKYRPNGQGQMEKKLESYKPRFQCRQIFE